MAEPMVADKQLVEQIFDAAAPRYDRAGPDLFRQFGARLVDWLEIPAGARALDVATGTGAVLIPAARRAGPDGHVTGVDLSNEMLAEADRAARATGLSNFQLGRMDAERLEFPDNSFDAVTCGFALFFCPSIDAAMAELGKAAQERWNKAGEW